MGMLFFFSVNQSASISTNINLVPMLKDNFKDWKESIMIILGCMDLDLVLRIEQPASLTDKSSNEEKRDIEKWERSNRMSLIIMKRGIPETFRGDVSEKVTTASEFLKEIE